MKRDYVRNYFDFQGKRYGVGTVVKIKPELYGSRRSIEKCNGIARFKEGFESGYLSFSGIVPPGEPYCGIAIRTNPDERIEKIIEPVYYEDKPVWQIAMENYQKTPKNCRADTASGTVIYIAVMLIGAMFNARILAWIEATLWYLNYLIDIYRD
jgi:hypothetical protein